jgi:hypothetical protein
MATRPVVSSGVSFSLLCARRPASMPTTGPPPQIPPKDARFHDQSRELGGEDVGNNDWEQGAAFGFCWTVHTTLTGAYRAREAMAGKSGGMIGTCLKVTKPGHNTHGMVLCPPLSPPCCGIRKASPL